jgi:starvation-inducible DNA-binding protein
MGTKANEKDLNLEYSKMEQAEMITLLNRLLSSYQVYFQKTMAFHWNVIGQDHFDLRQGFKSMFSKALGHMGEIADRIRLFNQKTIEGWTEIMETSEIKEAKAGLTGFEMVKSSVSDIRALLDLQTASIEKATDLGDFGTEILLKNHMRELEQDYLMLASWLK